MTADKAPEAETVSKAELEKEQEKRRRAQAELEDLKRQINEFGMSAKEVQAMKSQFEEFKKTEALKSPEKYEEEMRRKETEIRGSVQKELDAVNKKLAAALERNKELEVTDKVFSKAAAKFNADCHEDVKGYIRRFGDLGEDGGLVFKDENGKVRYAPGSTTQLMNEEQFIEELAGKKQSWAVATLRSGTKPEGTSTTTPQKGKYTPDSFRGKTDEQIQQAIKEGGAEAAQAFLSSLSN